ncbi:uncharacterized protein METZ01_LOCUS228204 [marine metagenome]|uniref:Uncharacterized protein n=1 Tax=marine metagenome TaxID=408172 RepID=A0A382GJP5_9ZZZZ
MLVSKISLMLKKLAPAKAGIER